MADPSYNTKLYTAQGGETMVVQLGGEVKIEAGGKITNDGTQAGNIPALTDHTGGTASTTLATMTSGTATIATFTDVATQLGLARNAIASIAEMVNNLAAAIEGVGITAGS